MENLDLHMRQDEPYHGQWEWLDEFDVPVPMPLGEMRMHIRDDPESRRLIMDVSAYLTRPSDTKVAIDLPPSVTIQLPAEAWYDVWAGDTEISEGRVLTDRSVTRRVYA